jgi:hypothetical protein
MLSFATDMMAVVGVVFALYALAVLLMSLLAAVTRRRDR